MRFLPLLLLILALPLAAQPTAETILEKSIAYHDPDGLFFDKSHTLTLRETRPDGPARLTTITLDFPTGGFAYRTERDGHIAEGHLGAAGDGCHATLDGSEDIAADLRERFRLSCEGLAWWNAYYGYMHSLPMNLADDGTRLDPAVKTVAFGEREVYELRVTYDEAVGSDVWYFYFDPATYALVGSRFYHDEAANDGEYIFHEGTVAHGTVRLPQTIRWITNADDRFLGADIIEAYRYE